MTTIDMFDDFWDTEETKNPYSFLSNFFRMTGGVSIATPWTGEMTADTTEHLYAAAKARRKKERSAILKARSPGEAKRLGRRCEVIEDWGLEKIPVMRLCIEAKFPAGTVLADQLVDTFPCNLREGTSWRDEIWGVDINNDAQPGQNLLGMLLMDHRSRLLDGLPPMGYRGIEL